MSNPLNPLDWVRSAQDWFTKTERASGFRPYLIFLIITCGLGLVLLTAFAQYPDVRNVALWILIASIAAFILIFGIKAFQDPDFCRSETHLHRMKKLELEYMGSESEAFPGELIEGEIAVDGTRILTDGETELIEGEAEVDDE